MAACRLRVSRDNESTLVLYIESLGRRDAGQYSCESDFDGQLATEHVQLIIHGQSDYRQTSIIPPSHSCLLCLQCMSGVV